MREGSCKGTSILSHLLLPVCMRVCSAAPTTFIAEKEKSPRLSHKISATTTAHVLPRVVLLINLIFEEKNLVNELNGTLSSFKERTSISLRNFTITIILS